jgi:hypothetical protein
MKKTEAYKQISAALSTIDRDKLESAIKSIWLSFYSEDDKIDPDKECSADQLDAVAQELDELGLTPGEEFSKLVKASALHCGVIQMLERECLYEGKNPRGMRMVVQEVGEPTLYNELSVSFHVGQHCLADVCLGLNSGDDNGEARILTSINGESDEHIVAIYPERPAPDCVDMEGA